MKCGWGCGEQFTASRMRPHFTARPRRRQDPTTWTGEEKLESQAWTPAGWRMLCDWRYGVMAYFGSVPVEKLLGGISRFQKDVYPKHRDLFEKLAIGQRPEALFITCADSRIDPCLLTQTKPGELFICRVIGNVVPPYPDALGGVSATIEYAVGVLRVPDVIVCGHTDCGVMRGALHPEALQAYPNVMAWLRYAQVERREAEPSAEVLLALAENNVVAQLKNLRSHPTVASRLEQGDLALHGWVYHIGLGTVTAYNEASQKFGTTASM
jgi:carbonic anhydrase